MNLKAASPLRTSRAENIIGAAAGTTTLCRAAVGKGQFIYIGWSIAASLPEARPLGAVEQETLYEEQYGILQRVIDSVYEAEVRGHRSELSPSEVRRVEADF